MSETQSVEQTSSEEGVILPDYRAVSGLAIAGLLLGLASVLVFVHPVLWIVPLAALVLCVSALRQIAAQPTALLGRRAALVGLAAALIFGISAPVHYVLYRYQLRAEAIGVAAEWFTALRDDRPFVAHQWSLPPEARWSLDENALVIRYMGETGGLKSYVTKPAVQMLLALGKRCHVRYYEHVGIRSDSTSDNVMDVYAVTVESQGKRVSFFIRVSMMRTYNLAANAWQWRVSQTDFIHSPPGQMGFDFTRL